MTELGTVVHKSGISPIRLYCRCQNVPCTKNNVVNGRYGCFYSWSESFPYIHNQLLLLLLFGTACNIHIRREMTLESTFIWYDF